MAMEVGADLGNMNETWWYPAASLPGEQYDDRPLARFIGVERTAPHSIIVDRFGDRFVNEAGNYNDMQKAFFSFDVNEYTTRHLPSWVVLTSSTGPGTRWPPSRPGQPDPSWLAVHHTLEGLAHKVGIDPLGLAGTVERWNRFVSEGATATSAGGRAPTTGSTGTQALPIPTWVRSSRGPYFALPVHIGSVGTKGGPRVDADGRVLHVRDRPIPGLYGAGNVAASPAGPAYYGGGTSIGMGLVWGH